jgi:hypothetical protein
MSLIFIKQVPIMADIVFERLYPESFRDTSKVPMAIGTENEREYYI